MHLFEFALRDFINVERYTSPTSVVVLDDMLPRSVTEAARDRTTSQWTGDVYKMVDVLREHRPDLTVVRVNTKPTGVVVVFGADSSSTVLRDHYDEILAAAIVPDPQPVPPRCCSARTRWLRRRFSRAGCGLRWKRLATRGCRRHGSARSSRGSWHRAPRAWRCRRPDGRDRWRHISGCWRARRDSNPRPPAPQAGALSTELRAQRCGGEGGIRTLGAGYPTRRFSKPLH